MKRVKKAKVDGKKASTDKKGKYWQNMLIFVLDVKESHLYILSAIRLDESAQKITQKKAKRNDNEDRINYAIAIICFVVTFVKMARYHDIYLTNNIDSILFLFRSTCKPCIVISLKYPLYFDMPIWGYEFHREQNSNHTINCPNNNIITTQKTQFGPSQ